jgi:hypothetical protein
VLEDCRGTCKRMQWQNERIAKGEMYGWWMGEESEETRGNRRSWRAVRKLAEVGLLTARKSASVPETLEEWCAVGGIGDQRFFTDFW